jgi:hypothetical protein
VCCDDHSDLVALESSLELDLAKPVVVGLLGLVVSVGVEGRSTTEVELQGRVQHCVNDNLLGGEATCHLFAFY